MRRYVAIAAWILLAAIFIFTDGPLSLRPVTGLSPNLERFMALWAAGLAFALAYPRRPLLVLGFLLMAVGLFELLQQLIHGRHGTIHDAAIKYLGVMAGMVAGYISDRITLFRR